MIVQDVCPVGSPVLSDNERGGHRSMDIEATRDRHLPCGAFHRELLLTRGSSAGNNDDAADSSVTLVTLRPLRANRTSRTNRPLRTNRSGCAGVTLRSSRPCGTCCACRSGVTLGPAGPAGPAGPGAPSAPWVQRGQQGQRLRLLPYRLSVQQDRSRRLHRCRPWLRYRPSLRSLRLARSRP